MITIASSWFNVEKMRFPWRETLRNWLAFLGGGPGQIVIAVNTSEDNTAQLVRDYAKEQLDPRGHVTVDVVDIAIPYTDPAFDGKGKAAAIAAAKQPYVILLDCDEHLVPRQRHLWADLCMQLERRGNIDGYLVPVVDLIGDERHYKSGGQIGSKWYLTRNSANITRGVWKEALREDGSIDTSRSDTGEAIYADTRDLIRAEPLLMPGLPHFMTIGQLESGQVPFVLHRGWLDKEQRLRQSAFWQPVWDQRNGTPGKEPAQTLEALDQIPRFRHNLLLS